MFKNSVAKIVITVFLYFLVVVTIMGGAYAFYKYYEKAHQTSETYGSLEYVDPYKDFELYNINLDDIEFNSDGELRTFETSFPVALEFDGENNKYNLLINNSPCNTEQSTFGFITGTYDLFFQDLDGSIISTAELNITVKVYASRVDVTVETTVNDIDYAYLLEYVDINGFKIRLIEEQYSKKVMSYFTPINLASVSVENVPDYEPTVENPRPVPIPETVNVVYNNIHLIEGKDYTKSCYISLQNGEYSGFLTITGQGKYTSSLTIPYSVPNLSNRKKVGFNGALEIVNIPFGGEEYHNQWDNNNIDLSSFSFFNGQTTYYDNGGLDSVQWETTAYIDLSDGNNNFYKTFRDDGSYYWSNWRGEEQKIYFSIGLFDGVISPETAYSEATFIFSDVVLAKETYTYAEKNKSLFSITFDKAGLSSIKVDLVVFDKQVFDPARIRSIKIENIMNSGGILEAYSSPTVISDAYYSSGVWEDGISSPGTESQRTNIEFYLNSEQSYYEQFVWDLVGLPILSGSNDIIIKHADNVYNLTWIIGETVSLTIDDNIIYFDFYFEKQKIMLQVNTNNFAILDNIQIIIPNLTYQAGNINEMAVIYFVDNQIYANYVFDSNTGFARPSDPIKDGYTFLGWSIDGQNVYNSDDIYGNTKFVALFEPL